MADSTRDWIGEENCVAVIKWSIKGRHKFILQDNDRVPKVNEDIMQSGILYLGDGSHNICQYCRSRSACVLIVGFNLKFCDYNILRMNSQYWTTVTRTAIYLVSMVYTFTYKSQPARFTSVRTRWTIFLCMQFAHIHSIIFINADVSHSQNFCTCIIGMAFGQVFVICSRSNCPPWRFSAVSGSISVLTSKFSCHISLTTIHYNICWTCSKREFYM